MPPHAHYCCFLGQRNPNPSCVILCAPCSIHKTIGCYQHNQIILLRPPGVPTASLAGGGQAAADTSKRNAAARQPYLYIAIVCVSQSLERELPGDASCLLHHFRARRGVIGLGSTLRGRISAVVSVLLPCCSLHILAAADPGRSDGSCGAK
jgi:hypothetical protein